MISLYSILDRWLCQPQIKKLQAELEVYKQSNSNLEDFNEEYSVQISEYRRVLNSIEAEKVRLVSEVASYRSELGLHPMAEFWDNKYPKASITYRGRYLPDYREGARKVIIDWPVELFVNPNDSIIKRDINNYGLALKNPLVCNEEVVTVYKHSRTKPLNPYRYTYEMPRVGVSELWYLTPELRKAKSGDCLPKDTKLLMTDGSLKQISLVKELDTIIGSDGKPTTILTKWDRGLKALLNIKLNNGDTLKVSDTHKFLVAKTKAKYFKGEFIEKKASELKVGDSLPYPKEIKFEECVDIDLDTAYLIGLYLADGWLEEMSTGGRIRIAGRDGMKKETQKQWVKEYCESRNIKYGWTKTCISIYDEDLYSEFNKWFGTGCAAKRFSFYNLASDTAKCILDGWKADATERSNELTYSTINPELALALRILWRICGYQVAIKKVEKHGGFGKNPIYRVTVHRKRERRLIIKEIEPAGTEHCYDIATEDGKIYLPEYDCIVRNCDDYGIELCSYLRAAGLPAWRIRCVAGNTWDGFGHLSVYVLADDFQTWYHINSTTSIAMIGNKTSLTEFPELGDETDGIGIKDIWFSFNDKNAWHTFKTDAAANTWKRKRDGFLKNIKIEPL